MSSELRSTPAAPQRPQRRASRFRIDIEGLRAVAILAVVLYHAHVGFLSGGYVGVDVFFVVSGFLITDLLWRELRDKGHLSFSGFYGRRMRRLLPASMLVLAVTVIVTALVVPPLEAKRFVVDGIACALYVGNYRFAATQTNYLAAGRELSPFQHYWSLGVEEQFYLVWPLLLMLAATGLATRRAARRPGRHRRAASQTAGSAVPSLRRAVLALAGVWVVSLVLSVWLTHVNEPWAFFSLPTRAWELATGGLIALGAPVLRRLRRGLAATLGWAGLAAVLISVLVLSASTAFPGLAALLPVLGSAGILLAGGVHRDAQGLIGQRLPRVRGLRGLAAGPVVVLGRRTPRAIGRISYSWYLWHWPVLILVPYLVGRSLDVWADLGLAAGSGLLAALTFVLVEDPARKWRWTAARPRRSLSGGAVLTAAGACVCLVAVTSLPSLKGHGVAPVAVVHSPGSGTVKHPARKNPATTKTTPTTQDPAVAAVTSTTDQIAAAVSHSVAATTVPSNLNPPLADAAASEAPPMVDGCLIGYTEDSIPPCQFGDTSSSTNVVLFGDSHADMWFPAIDSIANGRHWRLLTISKAACPPLFISLYSPVLGRQWTECSQWQQNALAAIRADHPVLVVMAIAPKYDPAYHVVQDGPQWLQGLATMISDIRQSGARVMLLGPVPAPPADVPTCLSAHLDDIGACNIPVTQPPHLSGFFDGIDKAGLSAEANAATRAGASFVNTERWFCTTSTCPVIVDNLLVYRDDSHITVPYAQYLAPAVSAEIDQALGGRA